MIVAIHRWAKAAIQAGVLCMLVAGTGCIYIPVKEVSPPALNVGTGPVRKIPLDVRKACSANGPLHAGMSRKDVHALIGSPDNPGDVGKTCRVRNGSDECYEFTGLTEYFYLFGESPVGTHIYLTHYTLTIGYDAEGRLVRCNVFRDSGVGG